MEEKWKKLLSNDPNEWYMLSDQGNIYKERVIYVDSSGKIRGHCKDRKTFKQIKRYEIKKCFDENRGCYYVCISLKGSDKCCTHSLHLLVAENFVPKPKTDRPLFVEFKDRNRLNPVASNLKWVRGSERWHTKLQNLPKIDRPRAINHVKIFKVPDWSVLYAKYTQYLKNRKKTSEIVLSFMRENGLYCGLVKTGWEEKIKKKGDKYELVKYPYFLISDNDPDIIKHDLEKLGNSARRRIGEYYPLRKNSEIMHKWVNKLKANDNFQILDVPSTEGYVVLHDAEKTNVRMRNLYLRSFAMEGNDLYLRIQSQHPFDVSDELIEVKGKEHLFDD